MSKIVTVYTKTACRPCAATKRKLTELGVPFIEADVTDPKLVPVVAEWYRQGLMQAPIVKVLDTETGNVQLWSGYQPTNLKKLKESAA